MEGLFSVIHTPFNKFNNTMHGIVTIELDDPLLKQSYFPRN